jgi:starvation-inducible DNA-binding protein
MAIRSPLDEQVRTATGDLLQDALVDLVDLSLTGKQAHWTVTGSRFRTLHLQLDEVVTAARGFADVIAERAAAIGVAPDARAATVAKDTGLPQSVDGWQRDDAVVTHFIETLRHAHRSHAQAHRARGCARPGDAGPAHPDHRGPGEAVLDVPGRTGQLIVRPTARRCAPVDGARMIMTVVGALRGNTATGLLIGRDGRNVEPTRRK